MPNLYLYFNNNRESIFYLTYKIKSFITLIISCLCYTVGTTNNLNIPHSDTNLIHIKYTKQ